MEREKHFGDLVKAAFGWFIVGMELIGLHAEVERREKGTRALADYKRKVKDPTVVVAAFEKRRAAGKTVKVAAVETGQEYGISERTVREYVKPSRRTRRSR